MRIVLTGGGTGGHTIPLGPLVGVLRTIHEEKKGNLPKWFGPERKLTIYFMGVIDKDARDYYQGLGLKVINIPAAKLRRYASSKTASDLVLRMPLGILKSAYYMWSIMPDVIISKGGYGSIPVGIAALFFRIPLVIHESDAVLGLANSIIANWAEVVTVGFAVTRHNMKYHKRKTIVTGTPVRQGLGRESKEDAKKLFGFQQEDKVLLVMGGSQGAKRINDLILELLPSLLPEMSVIHLAGKEHVGNVKKEAEELIKSKDLLNRYKVYGYLDDKIGPALICADVVVSRAGATSLAELAHLRKASIIIPLPTAARDHQSANARVFELGDAVRVISQENLGRNILWQNIRDLIKSAELRETLSVNIARFDHPNAARDVAGIAIKLATGLVPFQGAVGGASEKKKGIKKK